MPAFLTDLVRESDPVGFWIGVLICSGIGGVLLFQGLKAFWRLRLIGDTPTARVRSAPQGYVELAGKARPLRGTVSAKLTGISCCWYRWRIEKRSRSGRSDHWVTVNRGELERAFLLDDGTGECVIEPSGAVLRCRATERWYSGVRGGGRGSSSSVGSLFGAQRRYRMTEERISEGETIYVLGQLETPRRDVQTREALTRTLLKRWKRDPERLQELDRDGNGELDRAEWERARALASGLAERAERRVAAQPVRSRIGTTSDSRRPYLISTEGESALLQRLRWQAFSETLLGVVLCIGVAAATLTRLSNAP